MNQLIRNINLTVHLRKPNLKSNLEMSKLQSFKPLGQLKWIHIIIYYYKLELKYDIKYINSTFLIYHFKHQSGV
jgi:hypothetical protein